MSSSIFCALSVLFSVWDSSDTNVRPFDIAPQVPEALFIYLFF